MVCIVVVVVVVATAVAVVVAVVGWDNSSNQTNSTGKLLRDYDDDKESLELTACDNYR